MAADWAGACEALPIFDGGGERKGMPDAGPARTAQ